MTKIRIAWISILQAITIIAVMIGHLDVAGDMNPKYPVACWLDKLQAFQMPVFFFISGYLYVKSSLFPKTYIELVKSKMLRLVVPFLFMSFVMWGFKLCLDQSMLEHPVSLSWSYFMNVLFSPWNGPVRHLWFVETLLIFFLLSPLFKWTLRNKCSAFFCVGLGILLSYLPWWLSFYGNETLCLWRDCYHFWHFYFGMCVMQFDLAKYVQKKWALVMSALLYYGSVALFNEKTLVAITGIAFILSLSWVLSERRPNLLSNVGKYSYQIYLLHMLPIMVWKFVFKRHFVSDDTLWFCLCWIGSLLCAVYLPVIVAKMIEKCPKQLRMLIGL